MNFDRASVGESPSAAWRERAADSVRKSIFRKGQSKRLPFTPASPSSPCRKMRKTGTRFGVSVFLVDHQGLVLARTARSVFRGSDSPQDCHSLPLPLRALDAKGEKTGTHCGVPVFWWTIKGSFSRELRARSSAALTAHCAVIHSRFPFEPFRRWRKNGHPLWGARFLVDHQGLEPWTDRL